MLGDRGDSRGRQVPIDRLCDLKRAFEDLAGGHFTVRPV
jgi:hypothetical protein